jgi:hypothetical protein
MLRDRNIHFDSDGMRNSSWSSVLTNLLPFALFFGFWIILIRQVHAKRRSKESGSPPDAREAESEGIWKD